MNYREEALGLHRHLKGKIAITNKMDIRNKEDLSLVYTPGVAEPCKEIYKDKGKVYDYTIKGNSVAIVTDGSAVLGLGNIGPCAALPVMEGKAMLFKRFARIDAFPICLNTQEAGEIIDTVRRIAPTFGGINLEDIAAPKSFEIEEALQDLGIPVFHDDQHGTAIVVLGALINAAKVTGKRLKDLTVVINGSGAAGIAISRLLRCVDNAGSGMCIPVKEIFLCDRKGIIADDREDLTAAKQNTLTYSNTENRKGSLRDAMIGADVFIGVSAGGVLNAQDIRLMAPDPIVFALANPTPEIMPEEAFKGGAAVVGAGRSDFSNQINNALGFPGVFRGALDAKAKVITPAMKIAAAHAIANSVEQLSPDQIIPESLNVNVAYKVAKAVKEAALKK